MVSRYLPLLLLGISAIGHAQQNLFNIPSGDMTPTGKVFYQHQLNVYSPLMWESKSHFVYGISKRFEGGLNFVSLPIDFRKNRSVVSSNDGKGGTALFPAFLFTGQFSLLEQKRWKVSVGTQSGCNVTTEASDLKLLGLHYGLTSYQITSKSKVIVGPYYVNAFLAGKEEIGFMAGFEVPLTKKFHVMGDFISGTNAQSGTVLGGMYSVSKRIQICAGYLLPFPNFENKMGLVIELNLLGYDYL